MLDRVSPRGHTYIDVSPKAPWWGSRLVRRISGAAAVDRWRRSLPAAASPAAFATAALERLGVSIVGEARELEAIPTRGRVLFVANHPYGALDGLIAFARLGAVRPDLKVLANDDLCALSELASRLVPFDIAGPARTRRNAQAIRHALQWLDGEGALLIFPAGEVSHFDARARCVTDPPWSRAVAMLARRARAPIVPMHLGGRNDLPFQVASFIHPQLRTLMLPRQLRKRAGSRVPVRLGAPLPYGRLRHFDDEALTAHLRLSTYLLARAAGNSIAPPIPPQFHPVAPPLDRADGVGEVARLDASHRLLEEGDHVVLCANTTEIPHLVDEIGRLREIVARAEGAGTGRARDLDAHDDEYEHLVLWNRARAEIVGAYRIGRGRRGLAAAGRFRFRKPFFTLLGPTIELDRAFVRIEQQHACAPQMLLWKGIGRYLARHPRHQHLLGTVRIGANYHEMSRQLLVEFLRSHLADPLLGALVRPAHGAERAPFAKTLAAEVAMLGHLDALAALIADLEPDRKPVPALLRQYLRLGARLLEVDADTARGTAECLLMVDLRRTDARALRRCLPEDAATRLLAARD